MRTITIDFNSETVVSSRILGKIGEHNATTLEITVPEALSDDERTAGYRVAFNTGGKTIITESYLTNSFDVTVWKQLTLHPRLSLQVIAYDLNGEFVGKSNKLTFEFEPSVQGTEIEADESNPDLSSEIIKLKNEKVDKIPGKGLSTNDYTDVDKGIVEGVTSALAGKVDAVSGKGLSTEDFTTAEKTKLAGISENAKNVSVSASGTATDEVQFITVDGIEKKIAGGGAVNDVYVDGISVLDSEKIAQINLTGKEQKIYTGKMQVTSQSPMTLAWISEAGNSYADMRNAYENGSKVEIALMTGVNQWTKLACTTYDSSFFSFQLPLRFTGSAPIIHYFVVIDSYGISVTEEQIALKTNLNAGNIAYSPSTSYSYGTVGKEIGDLKNEIHGLNDLVGSGVIE